MYVCYILIFKFNKFDQLLYIECFKKDFVINFLVLVWSSPIKLLIIIWFVVELFSIYIFQKHYKCIRFFFLENFYRETFDVSHISQMIPNVK